MSMSLSIAGDESMSAKDTTRDSFVGKDRGIVLCEEVDRYFME